jgi:hypothetical protein
MIHDNLTQSIEDRSGGMIAIRAVGAGQGISRRPRRQGNYSHVRTNMRILFSLTVPTE